MGFEGSNVLFDTWIHPLMMGLEEHLLAMFREDFEFHDAQGPSHLGQGASRAVEQGISPRQDSATRADNHPNDLSSGTLDKHPAQQPANEPTWEVDAENELKKIPFFVRGKARKNTEQFARKQGLSRITVETLYDAKAYFAR
jgi:light-independent protochlorophyllide reductase subunit B